MAKPASRLENLRSLRSANLDVAFATAFATLTGGTFLIGFVKHLGGSDLWIGLVSAIPQLAGLMQVPGAIIGRRHGLYKGFIVYGGTLWRAFHLPLILLPLLALPDGLRLWLLATFLALGWAAGRFNDAIYNDWLAELVPPGSRGWYFSRRTLLATLVSVAAGIGGAKLLDWFLATDRARIGFSTVFAIGLVCAAISLVFFLRMGETARLNPARLSLAESLKGTLKPLADSSFRKVLVFALAFTAGQMFAGGLFVAFGLETLGLTFFQLQLTSISAAVGTLATVKFWGFLADRYGNKPVIAILTAGIVTTPLQWIICQPGETTRNMTILIAGHVFTGALWSGIGVCLINLFFATADEDERPNYLAAALIAQAAMGAAAPMLGASMMELLRTGMSAESAYKAVFLTASGLRLVALITLLPVRESGAISIRSALRQLGSVRPRGVAAMRQLSRSADAESRLEAIRKVGTAGMSLAISELREALSDPSPSVRREAAIALGSMRDEAASEALIRHCETHSDLVDEETLDALGSLRSPAAADTLIRFIEDPSATLRRAAAKALGRLDTAKAVEPLKRAARDPRDPDLRSAALRALSNLHGADVVDVVHEAIMDPISSVRVAAAETAAELEIAECAPALRYAMQEFKDDVFGEVAYALGAVGVDSDCAAIAQAAERAAGPAARRRCLLGIARRLGSERSAYRLLTLSGVEQDQSLMALAAGATSNRMTLVQSVELYCGGDEPAALAHLRPYLDSVAGRAIANCKAPEAFIVALAALRSE